LKRHANREQATHIAPMPSQNLTDAQIVDCTLAFCKKQEIDVSSSAVAISFQLLPTICAARANAKKAALTVTERKDAKAAGVTFDDPEENCAALIVNPSAGTLAAGYKATDSVAYKKGRFGDWNFEYSLNLGAASLMHAEAEAGASAPQTPVQPFCCSEVAEYWRWASSGLHGLEPHDKKNEARCAALVKGEGSFDDIVFEVVTHEMSGPANYGYPVGKVFYQLLDDKILPSRRDYDCQLDAYRNYCCKKHGKFYTINIFNVRQPMVQLRHMPAMTNFFLDLGVLQPAKAVIVVDNDDED